MKLSKYVKGILIGFLVCQITSCNWLSYGSKVEIQHIFSPNGEREAVLLKNTSNYTYLRTISTDRQIETDYAIYGETNLGGDKLTDFISRFPVRKWLNNRIFFIGFNEPRQNSTGRIYIKNSSSKLITQIEISNFESHFVYDIFPNESVEIPVDWSTDNSLRYSTRCHVSTKVYFEDGSRNPLSVRFKDTILNTIENENQCENLNIVVSNSDVLYLPISNQ
jgi:hypothetical protein